MSPLVEVPKPPARCEAARLTPAAEIQIAGAPTALASAILTGAAADELQAVEEMELLSFQLLQSRAAEWM